MELVNISLHLLYVMNINEIQDLVPCTRKYMKYFSVYLIYSYTDNLHCKTTKISIHNKVKITVGTPIYLLQHIHFWIFCS